VENNWDFNHIGLVVKDINKVEKFVKLTGIGHVEKFSIDENGVQRDVKWLLHIGALTIDLHKDIPEEVLVNESIKKDGQGLHHIAFHVDDIEKEIQDLSSAGAKLLMKQDITDGVLMKKGILAFLSIQDMGVALELKQIDES